MFCTSRKNSARGGGFHGKQGVLRLFLFIVAMVLLLSVVMCAAACNDTDVDEDLPIDDGESDVPSEQTPQSPDEQDALKKFEGVTFSDISVVYDGLPHFIEIEAEALPIGTTVTYTRIECVDAGEYTLVATLKLKGYETLSLTATLTILPAAVHAEFYDAEFVWDGQPHFIYVSGDLPAGATVTYSGNGMTEVGEYAVTAHIEPGKNYLPIEDLTATLTILERTYVVSFEHWNGATVTYTVPRGSCFEGDAIPANFACDGYEYTYWDPDELELVKDVRSDVNVHELCGGLRVYRVVFDTAGGIINAANFGGALKDDNGTPYMEYTAESDITLEAPFRYGFIFLGWFDEEGRLVTSLPDEYGMRNMTLTARWEEEGRAS